MPSAYFVNFAILVPQVGHLLLSIDLPFDVVSLVTFSSSTWTFFLHFTQNISINLLYLRIYSLAPEACKLQSLGFYISGGNVFKRFYVPHKHSGQISGESWWIGSSALELISIALQAMSRDCTQSVWIAGEEYSQALASAHSERLLTRTLKRCSLRLIGEGRCIYRLLLFVMNPPATTRTAMTPAANTELSCGNSLI